MVRRHSSAPLAIQRYSTPTLSKKRNISYSRVWTLDTFYPFITHGRSVKRMQCKCYVFCLCLFKGPPNDTRWKRIRGLIQMALIGEKGSSQVCNGMCTNKKQHPQVLSCKTKVHVRRANKCIWIKIKMMCIHQYICISIKK